jgi:hypothetical protein
MVSHLRKEDEVGRMLQTSIDQLQIQAGTSSWAVLSRPGKKARMYVDACYASHTWAFLDRIGSAHIRLELTTWTRPQRVGDRFIMDDVANLPGIKPIELVYVQRVRLFLVSRHLLTFHPLMAKPFATGHYQSKRTHANPCSDSPDKNDHRHHASSQPGTGLSDCATPPL